MVALPLSIALAQPAFAHSRLLSSDPQRGAHLSQPPTKVTLTFSEPVDVRYATVALTIGEGEPAPLGLSADGGVLTGQVPPDIAVAGGATEVPWKVTYRVTSKDGHPISGVVDFTVAAGKGAGQDSGEDTAATRTETPAQTASPVSDTSAKANGGFPTAAIGIPIVVVAAGAVVALVIRQRRHERS
jgi:methionine-rich copper-binding protein CopC